MYQILSAVLNTGNIEFTAITSQHQTDKSEVPNSEALENGETERSGWPLFLLATTQGPGVSPSPQKEKNPKLMQLHK